MILVAQDNDHIDMPASYIVVSTPNRIYVCHGKDMRREAKTLHKWLSPFIKTEVREVEGRHVEAQVISLPVRRPQVAEAWAGSYLRAA